MTYSCYQYAFYHFYAWGLKQWGSRSYPQYWAAFVVAIFAILNIYSVLILLEVIFKVKLFSLYVIGDKPLRGTFVLAVFFLHYFLFVRDRRYEKIAREFSGAPKSVGSRRATYLGMYTSVTVLGFI